MFGGSAQPAIVVYEAPGNGYAGQTRYVSAADLHQWYGDTSKWFSSVVILSIKEGPKTSKLSLTNECLIDFPIEISEKAQNGKDSANNNNTYSSHYGTRGRESFKIGERVMALIQPGQSKVVVYIAKKLSMSLEAIEKIFIDQKLTILEIKVNPAYLCNPSDSYYAKVDFDRNTSVAAIKNAIIAYVKCDIIIPEDETEQATQASTLTTDQLKAIAKNRQSMHPQKQKVSSFQYKRDPYIAELAKREANGICQLCKEAAPFDTPSGEPYLESHHIKWLSKGGSDTIENTVAVCPNCHKKLHILNRKQDIRILELVKES